MRVAGKNIVVCGLGAYSVAINWEANHRDVTTYADPSPVKLSFPPTIRAEFLFMLNSTALDIYDRRFQVGDGQFYKHSLGPADVCEYCGTAWLPGTIKCPSCAGSTTFKDRAIERVARHTGVIERKELSVPTAGMATLTITVRFFDLAWTADGITEMFRHDLWYNDPALWLCNYCGYVVRGDAAKCPGCAGSRQPIEKLASQQRMCLWCGKTTTGGYACKSCNMRLKGVL